MYINSPISPNSIFTYNQCYFGFLQKLVEKYRKQVLQQNPFQPDFAVARYFVYCPEFSQWRKINRSPLSSILPDSSARISRDSFTRFLHRVYQKIVYPCAKIWDTLYWNLEYPVLKFGTQIIHDKQDNI